ncbi:pyridoxal phosphate-dependent transferase, partial [Lophiotrema nucula]
MFQQKLAAIASKRASAGPLPPGSAPYTSSTHFRVNNYDDRPKAKRWDQHFSTEASQHRGSALRAAAKGVPESTITLGTARPSSEFYPWQLMTMYAESPSAPIDPIVSMTCSKGEDAYDLAVAFNYSSATGSPQILRFITEHVEMMHSPQYSDWETIMTCGSTSATDLAFRIFCDCDDWILVEERTYPGTVCAARNQGLKMVGVKMDGQGLMPEDLERILDGWDAVKGRKPSLLYMIPTGHNPTGATQGLARRNAIYAIAEKHNLYIVEDDPYMFLQLGEPGASESSQEPLDEYIAKLPPSYLSLDVSGRVLRMDSTSKILAPGLRLGWITGSAQVIEKFVNTSELSVNAPNGPSQVMLYKLLEESWGHEGFMRWLQQLSARYRRRRDMLVEACQRHLPHDLCSWIIPREGMFVWVRLAVPKQSIEVEETTSQSLLAIEDQVYQQARTNGVLLSKGSWFTGDPTSTTNVAFRITFAAAPESDLQEAARRFGEAVR